MTEGIAKGYITDNWKEAEEYYMRWSKEYGEEFVEMVRINGKYEIKVLPFKLELKK